MTNRITNVATTPREHAKLVRGPGDGLIILLEPIGFLRERGIYPRDDKFFVPKRYLGLAPDAAGSLRRMENDYPGVMYYSDIFRNATGSKGRRQKNRAKRIRQGKSPIYTGKIPGDSAHSFGECADHDLSGDPAMNREGNLERLADFLKAPSVSKAEYDELWKGYGWWCHRDGPHGGDHKMAHEAYHFNHFGDDPERWLVHSGRKTSGGVEAKVQYKHGPFTLDEGGIVEHLTRLDYLEGPPPGDDIEHLRYGAIRQFQKDWTLPADGIAGPQTQRVLLYVGAELRDASTGQGLDLTFP